MAHPLMHAESSAKKFGVYGQRSGDAAAYVRLSGYLSVQPIGHTRVALLFQGASGGRRRALSESHRP
jgi:hypothetical protein